MDIPITRHSPSKLSLIGICLLFLIGFPVITAAQTLSAGDVAFVGFNAEDNSYAVVLFKNVPAGKKIQFTSKEWNGQAFTGTGGDMTWIAPDGGILAGTVLVFRYVEAKPTVNIGSVTVNSNLNLSSTGDVIYAFLGADRDHPNTFLGTIATSEDEYNQPDGTEGTLANTGLKISDPATILLNENVAVAQYTGDRRGDTQRGYLEKLNNTNDNWVQGNNTGNHAGLDVPVNTHSFKLVNSPIIQFTSGKGDVKGGWRFISTPTKKTTFRDLLGNLWIQGIPNSDAPTVNIKYSNVRIWNEAKTKFQPIKNMKNKMIPGKGYLVYVYRDNDALEPDIQGGFPKIISPENDHENGPVTVMVTSHKNNIGSEGWNLLGNPYESDISVDVLLNSLDINNSINNNVYVWNPDKGSGNGGYDVLTKGTGKTVAPFQAFFIHYNKAFMNQTVNFTSQNLTVNGESDFINNSRIMLAAKKFKLFLGNSQKFDVYQVRFRKGGTIGEDQWDAYKLFSLNPNPIELYSTVGNKVKLAENVLPPLRAIKNKIHIPLTINVPESGQYKFRWSIPADFPINTELYLIDLTTGRRINLLTTRNYQFQLHGSNRNKREALKTDKEKIYPPVTTKAPNNNITKSRFELLIIPAAQKSVVNSLHKTIKKTKLLSLYPNPFTSRIHVKMQIKNRSEVTVAIYNIIGQKIISWNEGSHQGVYTTPAYQLPSNSPSGVYICWVKIGDKVFTKKMTYIK